jgi:hypothetical protein
MTKAKRQNLRNVFATVPEDKATKPIEKVENGGGRKAKLFQLPESAKKQLAILAIESEKTQQALLTEALNDLFRKYGKPEIA